MGTRLLAALVFVASIFGVAGCESPYGEGGPYPGSVYGQIRLHDPHALVREARFDRDEFEIWGEPHEIPAVVFGNPLPMDKKAFDELVLERVRTNYWSIHAVKPSLTFVPGQRGIAEDAPRLVAAFDYAPGLGPEDLCRAETVATEPPDETTIRMRFTLCRGDHLMAATRTSMWRGSADADYRFRRRISDLAFGLFPYKDLRPSVTATPSGLIISPLIGHNRPLHPLRRR